MKRVAILGFGREGKSVLKFIKKLADYRNAEIWILDQNPKIVVPRGVKTQFGKRWLNGLSRFDIIFRSPGVPYESKALLDARRRGVKISSATKLFFEHSPGTIIGVTGTKGKGTTTTLLYKILKAAKRDVVLGGNIGISALDLLPRIHKKTLVVLELSSFQLQDLSRSPHIAAILDVFPDHQDAHKSLREYYEAKANIGRFQKAADVIFYASLNPISASIAKKSKAKRISVSGERHKLFYKKELKMPGVHNFKNAAMAAAIAQYLKVPKEIVRKATIGFAGNEHRLELVKTLKGIRFVNDSASTNPETSAAAVLAFPKESKILIAGGYDKGLGYSSLARALRNSATHAVILYGSNREKMKRAISKSGPTIVLKKDLSGALRTAYETGLLFKTEKPVIILSPGAASFDQFQNYAERGKEFKKLVNKLTSQRKKL